jgi:ribosomal protein L10
LAVKKLLQLMGDKPHAWFAMVENIHAFPADQIRKTIHNRGTAIPNSSVQNKEQGNA